MQSAIKIGTNTFKVIRESPVIDEKGKVVWANIDSVADTIRVDNKLSLPRQKEAVLHECIHGVAFSIGEDPREAFVNRFSLGFYRWMLDNKSLVKWLIE